MRLLNRWLSLAAALWLMVAGCDSGDSPEPARPDATQLDIFHMYSEGVSVQPELVEQGRRFERENPQFQIRWTWGGSEGMQKLRARINAGDPPDAAINSDANLTLLAREGIAVPLDDVLAGQNYQGDARWQDTFWPGALQNAFVPDGAQGPHYYSIPWVVHVSGIYYNKGLFESKGYGIPATWDELKGLCETIQSEVGIPCFAADNFDGYNARLHLYIAIRLVGRDRLYDTATNKKGTSWTDEPGFLQAAGMAREFAIRYYAPGWEGNRWPAGQVEWANEGTAMIIMPTWLPSELRDAKAEDFVMDLFPVPAIAGGRGDPDIAEIKFNGWFIPAGARHPEDAIHFIKFLTSSACQRENMAAGDLPPAIEGVPLPPGVEGARSILEGKGGMRFAAGLDADAPNWLERVYYPLNDRLLLGQVTPAEFIAQLQEAHDAFYASR